MEAKPIRVVLTLCLCLLLSGGAVCAAASPVGSLAEGVSAVENGKDATNAGVSLGYVAADAARWAAGTDLALINGGELTGSLPGGPVAESDIQGALRRDAELAVAVVTPARLFALLEQCLSHIVLDLSTERIDREASSYGGFPQVSGMRLVYNASALPMNRLMEVTLEDGRVLDPDDTETQLTLVATWPMMEGDYGLDPIPQAERIGTTLSAALTDYVARFGTEISITRERGVLGGRERVRSVGSTDNPLISALPTDLLIIVLLVMICFGGVAKSKKLQLREERF